MQEELYKQHILDHATHPRNKKALDTATHVRNGVNPSCGDTITLSIRVRGVTIEDAAFAGVGCAISQAACSLLTTRLIGSTIKEVRGFREDDMINLLGVPVTSARKNCALLAYRALQHMQNDLA